MYYAVPTNRAIVTSKRVATKRILSDETRKRKEFFASSSFISPTSFTFTISFNAEAISTKSALLSHGTNDAGR